MFAMAGLAGEWIINVPAPPWVTAGFVASISSEGRAEVVLFAFGLLAELFDC